MSHTAGPWKVIPSPHGPKYACVQIGKDDMYTTLEMLPADAKLIAAAPDMAAALQGIIDAYGDADDMSIVRCKAALKKSGFTRQNKGNES